MPIKLNLLGANFFFKTQPDLIKELSLEGFGVFMNFKESLETKKGHVCKMRLKQTVSFIGRNFKHSLLKSKSIFRRLEKICEKKVSVLKKKMRCQ